MGGIWGQDWASYQSPTPDTSGLSFAFVKVTEGLSYINPEWRSQRDHAKANGLVWGAYHYPHMHNSDRAEADFFLAQVDWQPGDMLVLDWEGYDTANQSVSAADQLAYKEDYLQYLKSRMPHNPVGMYCNTDYWNRVDTTGHAGDFLWIATAGRAAGSPGIRASWLFHQYSDQPLDSDYCPLGSTAELRAWAQSFAANPQEDDMPFSEQDIRRFIREEASGQTVRDANAYAVFWWLMYALQGTVPAGAQGWDDLINTAHDNLAASSVAAATWAHTEVSAKDGNPVGMGAVMGWMDKVHDAQTAAVGGVGSQVTALQAAIAALATQLGQVHGVDTATVVTAVQDAIAKATVHVQVDVANTTGPAMAAPAATH